MTYVKSYRELKVYQQARELARSIFLVSKDFPKEETFALTDQIRRSSRAIGAAIAESWGKRRYEKHFVSKLSDADSEQMETQHWIETAFDCGYLTGQEATSLLNRCQLIGRLLGGMMAKASSFCSQPPTLREKPSPYFAKTPHLTDYRYPNENRPRSDMTDYRLPITNYGKRRLA